MRKINLTRKSARPEFLALKAGVYNAALTSVQLTDSFHDSEGFEKTDLPTWADPTPQILISLKANEGSYFHRLNLLGFARFSEMEEDFIAEYGVEEDSGYALIKNSLLDEDLKDPDAGDNDYVRIPDDKRIDQCNSILDQLMWAVFGSEGKTIEDLQKAIGTVIEITLEQDPYTNKDGEDVSGIKLTKFAQVKAEVEA